MSLTADLTSSDLDEIRRSALGAADPLGVAADLAGAADAGRLADPGDAGYALTLAAEIAESRAKLEAALHYVDRALEAYGDSEESRVAAARALRARILFRAGRGDEAMAGLEPLRPLLTTYPDAPAYVSAALAAGGRNRIAEQWLTEAVHEVRAATPEEPEGTGLLFFLLQQRHRVRHALGLPHDANDDLADRLETRLANAAARPAADPADDLVFWPSAEFDKLIAQWPVLSESYGKDFDEHRARLERELVRLTAAGRSGLAVFPASVAGLTRHAGDGDPADARTRTGYARQLAAGSGIAWPPERNAACWCGSGLKYKKCCLPRSR